MWEEDGRNKGEYGRMEKNTQVNLGVKGGKTVASMRSLPTVLLTCRDPLQYWSWMFEGPSCIHPHPPPPHPQPHTNFPLPVSMVSLTSCSFRRYYSADEGTSFDAYLARFDSDAKGGVSPRAKKKSLEYKVLSSTNIGMLRMQWVFLFFLGGGGCWNWALSNWWLLFY